MNTTVNVRFVGTKTAAWVAFVTVNDGAPVRVALDPRNRPGRPWKCALHGTQAAPGCVHTDLADAANQLRTERIP